MVQYNNKLSQSQKVKMQLIVDDNLWDEFKKITTRDVTLHEKVIQLIEEEIDRKKGVTK